MPTSTCSTNGLAASAIHTIRNSAVRAISTTARWKAQLRIINRRGGIEPGSTHTIRTANQTIEAEVVLRGQGWHNDEFKSFHFVSDYEVQGLQNHYHSYGLGVPMIAVRKHQQHDGAQEKYYPPGMSFPVTAFLRVLPNKSGDGTHHVAHLELHDPLNTSEISVDSRRIPLESDLTTPLAYALNQKDLQDLESSTVGLLNVAKTEKLQGLYMLEPYQPGKIPVIMVHGVWSSPITWMAMFNDLRSARRSAAATSSGSIFIPADSHSGIVPPICARPWPKRANCWTPPAGNRRLIKWCWWDTAWADCWPGCKRSIAPMNSGAPSATIRFKKSRHPTKCARSWPAHSSLAPAPRCAA